MPRATNRRPAAAWAALALGLLALGLLGRPAQADRPPLPAAIGGPAEGARSVLPPRLDPGRRPAAAARSSGGWWLGTAGIALALAVFGAVSVASRRYLPAQGSGPLRVVGRTSLSPKHTVYLLEAGGRVLIVGAGPQGAPSLLGELTDPDEIERIDARRSPAPRASADRSGPSAPRFDERVGDDA